MKRVIVYRRNLLPHSETFIKQQILSLCGWQAILAGQDRVKDGLDVDGLALAVDREPNETRLQKIRKRFFWKLGWPRVGFYRQLIRFDASLVHVHFGVDAVTAWPWLKHMKMPVVVTLHGYDISIRPDYWENGWDARMRTYPQKLREISLEQNVSFIAVSNALRQKAIDLYGLPAEKIKVLYIGVDEKTFTPVDVTSKVRSKKILFVGRLVEKKGASVLIESMRQVVKQVPDAELLIVGDGSLRGELEALATNTGVPASFLGVQPSVEIRRLMQEARIFCLPSITAENGDTEGFGIVILEAQACGTPVVTSAVGGRDEGIDEGVTGLAFAEGDVDGLTARLVRLLQDDDLTLRMSDAAPKFIADKLSLTNCTARLEAHYDTLVDQYNALGRVNTK